MSAGGPYRLLAHSTTHRTDNATRYTRDECFALASRSRLIACSSPRASTHTNFLSSTTKDRNARYRQRFLAGYEVNARWQLASQRKAEAEADTVFDAAAAFIDAAPERARPSLWRAEKDKESPTTSLSPLSRWLPTMSFCTCFRAAAVLTATHAVDEHQSRSWAPAPAATIVGQPRCGAASASKAADTCLITAVR